MITLKNIRVSKRYSTALFHLAMELNILEDVKKDMLLVANVVKQSNDLLVVFRSPLINISKKVNIINAIFGPNVSELTLKFLILISRKGRIVCLDSIANIYIDMHNIHYNIQPIFIEVADNIDNDIKTKVIKIMENHTNSSIDINEEINPKILGGFRLRFSDYIYDASLKYKINLLKKEFEKNIYEKKF